MMKAYVKPELFYERYELSQHIADCAWELNSKSEYDCIFVGDKDKGLGGYTLFSSDRGCILTEDNTEWYCYMPGTEGMNTFIS